MKALIIGARRDKIGLGKALIEYFESICTSVESVCRDNYKTPFDLEADFIVVNLYDRFNPLLQLEIVQTIFEQVKTNQTFI